MDRLAYTITIRGCFIAPSIIYVSARPLGAKVETQKIRSLNFPLRTSTLFVQTLDKNYVRHLICKWACEISRNWDLHVLSYVMQTFPYTCWIIFAFIFGYLSTTYTTSITRRAHPKTDLHKYRKCASFERVATHTHLVYSYCLAFILYLPRNRARETSRFVLVFLMCAHLTYPKKNKTTVQES